MLKNFLFQTCDVYNYSLGTISGGEQSKTPTALTTGVKCKLYQKKPRLTNVISEKSDNIEYELIIEPITSIMIEVGYSVDIRLPVALGKYRIKNDGIPKWNIKGQVDHLAFKVEKWQ